MGRLVGGNDDGGKTDDPPTPGVVSNDLGYYCCLDDESLVFICKKLNVDVKEMLVLNRRHITELTSHAKLIEGTCLDLPEEVVLPKAINDERLRASQAKLPLTSLKELHKLKHHDVVSKVNMEQLMVTLHSVVLRHNTKRARTDLSAPLFNAGRRTNDQGTTATHLFVFFGAADQSQSGDGFTCSM